jgi:hypothetical protein
VRAPTPALPTRGREKDVAGVHQDIKVFWFFSSEKNMLSVARKMVGWSPPYFNNKGFFV